MAESIYSEPMPSPNGTNYERLYIIRKPLALAMDQAMGAKYGGYGSADKGDPNDIDLDERDNEGYTLGDKVRQLLEGKLDDADLQMLIQLIEGPDDTDIAPALDRRGRSRQAHDRMPSLATMERLVADGAVRRAERVQQQTKSLIERFPALKGARVV